MEKNRIVDVAESWIGTPFRSLHREKGVGVDCISLCWSVWNEAGLYTPDPIDYKFSGRDNQRVLEEYMSCFEKVALSSIKCGDWIVVMSRPLHNAVYIGNNLIIHALRRGGVCKSALSTLTKLNRELIIYRSYDITIRENKEEPLRTGT